MSVRDVRPSLDRTLVIPVNDAAAAATMLALAHDMGLITHSGDVRLTMDVCPGAPACANGTTRTRDDAQLVAKAMTELGAAAPSIHISGCAKGCARRTAAAFTFVARDGLYDLILDGTAHNAPVRSGIAAGELASAIAAAMEGPAP